MEKLPLHKALILLLGLMMAVGAAVATAQASSMTVEMALAAGMDGGGQDDCNGCPGGNDGDTAQCVPVCGVAGFALLPAVSVHKAVSTVEASLPMHLAARGKPSSPDPYPPRPRDFS